MGTHVQDWSRDDNPREVSLASRLAVVAAHDLGEVGDMASRHRELTSTLSELAALVVDDGHAEATAERVVRLAMDTLDCDFAGLTILRRKARFESMAVSDPV